MQKKMHSVKLNGWMQETTCVQFHSCNVPTQSGKLVSQILRSVQINVRLLSFVSRKTYEESQRQFNVASVWAIRRPFIGGIGIIQPIAVVNAFVCKLFIEYSEQKKINKTEWKTSHLMEPKIYVLNISYIADTMRRNPPKRFQRHLSFQCDTVESLACVLN